MTIVKDLFNRYIWLVDTIFRAGRITFDEIDRRWQRSLMSNGKPLPPRTFHRHRQDIEEIFDIIIKCDRHTDYSYFIENKEDMEQSGIRAWLLNTFAVNNLISESHHLKRRILFEEIPSGQRWLTAIIEAMNAGYMLKITHQSFDYDASATFEVQPLCIKVFRQRWYLAARSSKGLYIYALDRIQNVIITEHAFQLPKDFNASAIFEHSFGVIIDPSIEPCLVRIKVYGNQRNYIRTLPLHSSQRETETTDDYSVFTYFLKPAYDFRQELLSHGYSVEVLHPHWLRHAMADATAQMSSRYDRQHNL